MDDPVGDFVEDSMEDWVGFSVDFSVLVFFVLVFSVSVGFPVVLSVRDVTKVDDNEVLFVILGYAELVVGCGWYPP